MAASGASSQGSMEEIKKIFNKFDKNGDGKISGEELSEILSALGSSTTSSDEVNRIMQEMDKDGDGYIDFDEFVAFYCGGGGGGSDNKDLKDAFDLYDLDKNGLISARELHAVMKKLGEKCSLSDCVKMIRQVDKDGDGSVNFDEFKKMMSNS